jgi:hypothetical protein
MRQSMRVIRHFGLLLALTLLTGCSELFLAVDEAPKSETADYRQVVATAFKTAFRDYISYDGFEISAPRMVHSMNGMNWLTCVRFGVQGERRTYVFFIRNDQVVTARYNVQTDECGAQNYAPFDAEMGKTMPGTTASVNPLY